jgi:hypothetical protein
MAKRGYAAIRKNSKKGSSHPNFDTSHALASPGHGNVITQNDNL